MRGLWRRIGLGLLVLPALLLVAAGGGFLWLRSGLPRDEGTLRLAGLTAPVTVIRDRDGVPLIRATSEADAYFALGFVHAQDRLWQMELHRRIPAGRLAELFGAQALPVDRLMRTIGLYRRIVASMDGLPPEVRRALAAYAAGVNAWLAARTGPLPPEFLLVGLTPEPWRPVDALAWGALMTMRLSGNWRGELLRARLARRLGPTRLKVLFPDAADDTPATLPDRRALYRRLPLDRLWAALPRCTVPSTASNEWVVSGRRSATGKPVLANDPHLGFTAPGLWYLARIETPELKLTGATVPGVPFTILGHNGTIAWGFTTTTSDVEDVFIEKLDPTDPTRYLTPDGPRRFTRRTETIKVRGGTDVTLEIRETRHGPVLDGLLPADPALPGRGYVLALAATYLAPDNGTATAMYRLNRARDWRGFVAALRSWSAPQQNIVYADIQGNIGFYAPGRVPIRRAGDGFMPAPGWTGSHDWIGVIPFAALPNVYNPAGGVIVNANNRVVPPGYPYFISRDWSLPYRANRILKMLATRPRLTLDGAARMQADIRSLMARDMLPLLLRFPATGARDRKARAVLRRWDGAMDRTRPEPLIFSAWMRALARALFADETGALYPARLRRRPRVLRTMLTRDTRWCDDVRTTARRESCGARVAAALATALADLTKRYGAEMKSWRWGAAHRASFRNRVLERVPVIGGWANIDIATDGGDFTVNRGTTNPGDAKHPFRHVHGAGFRAIYDLSDLGRSRFMQATGQSGNPFSRHYRDLNRRWRDFDTLRLSASPKALLAAGGKRLILVPAAETPQPKPVKE